MSWATLHIAALQRGETVRFRPKGHSMTGVVNDGDLVEVMPLSVDGPRKGDVVLCHVAGHDYLHLVKATGARGVLIGNNRGGINGWTPYNKIFGIGRVIAAP